MPGRWRETGLALAGALVAAGWAGAQAPPGTDIWLATLETAADGAITVGEPANVTARPGYDNQPHFTPDGSGFWFTVIDDHTGQADIWRYDIEPGTIRQIIASNPESEYSATPLEDGSGISVIRVEADSTQRLWRFDLRGSNGSVVLPRLAPVGYHVWADDRTLVMFVLGSPPTLRMGNVNTGNVETLAENIGRSIQRIPGSHHVSYVQRQGEERTTIMRLRPGLRSAEPIVDGIDGGDDHAWTPDGALLQASGAKLYAFRPGTDDGWRQIADFSELGITLSRLAVSPDGRHIALVAEID